MLDDVIKFLPDIQSINPKENSGFVLFCNNKRTACSVQQQLLQRYGICSALDVDNWGDYYIIPFEQLDEKVMTDFICHGWEYDRNQKFTEYLITVYNEGVANKIHNILIAAGYNVILSSNNMQLTVKCLENSPRNTEIQKLKSELEKFEKASPKSIDDYFNKILFNGVIEKHFKIHEQEFDIDTIKQNKDLIVREILYRYFNRKIRVYLIRITFPKKFDANKLNSRTIQNINLVRDFLYSVAEKYVDTQMKNAIENNIIIRFDYLKKCDEYSNVENVLKLVKAWQRSNIKQNRIKQRDIRMSGRFAYKLMDLNDGYYVVYLASQEALNYENNKLKHGAEIYYDDDIYEGFTRYSIRKEYTPLVTLEIYNDKYDGKDNYKVVKCWGYKNEVPCDSGLREAVRMFMHERNLTIPDNSWNKLIAYIKQHGVLYDVFDLPNNFVIESGLNLEQMGLDKLPKMPAVTVNGHLLCHENNLNDLAGAPKRVLGNCDFSKNPLTSLYGVPREVGGLILLSGHKLTSESFVPMYIENKLNDILGVDKEVIVAWKEQIAQRKTGIQNIIASLRNR